MLKKWAVLLLCASAASAVMIAGANAVGRPATTPTINLSSRAAVLGYLASHGIDSKHVVIQRGKHNYAGPNCPGKGWTCTKAKHVVQFSYAPNTANQFTCTASTGGTSVGPNTCVIVQVSS